MPTVIEIPKAALKGGKLVETIQFDARLADEIRDRGLGVPAIRPTLRPTSWRKNADGDIEVLTFNLVKLEVIIP